MLRFKQDILTADELCYLQDQLVVFKKIIWLLESFTMHHCTDRQELLSSLH